MSIATLLYVLAFNFNGAVSTLPKAMPLVECIEQLKGLNPDIYQSAVCINSLEPKRQVTATGPNIAELADWGRRRAIPTDDNFYTDSEKGLIYGKEEYPQRGTKK